MKNSNDTIGNRTRDLPACSALPQTTTPSHATGMTGVGENCSIIHFIINNVVQKIRTGRVSDFTQRHVSTNPKPHHVCPYAIHVHTENLEILSTSDTRICASGVLCLKIHTFKISFTFTKPNARAGPITATLQALVPISIFILLSSPFKGFR